MDGCVHASQCRAWRLESCRQRWTRRDCFGTESTFVPRPCAARSSGHFTIDVMSPDGNKVLRFDFTAKPFQMVLFSCEKAPSPPWPLLFCRLLTTAFNCFPSTSQAPPPGLITVRVEYATQLWHRRQKSNKRLCQARRKLDGTRGRRRTYPMYQDRSTSSLRRYPLRIFSVRDRRTQPLRKGPHAVRRPAPLCFERATNEAGGPTKQVVRRTVGLGRGLA